MNRIKKYKTTYKCSAHYMTSQGTQYTDQQTKKCFISWHFVLERLPLGMFKGIPSINFLVN